MKFKGLNYLLLCCAFLLAGAANAYDFTAADGLFHQRGGGPDKIAAALSGYTEALNHGDLNSAEMTYAAEQKSRLYMYWGYIVDQSDRGLRIDIANQCLSSVESIKPTAQFAAVPHYYFWKAACLMTRANAQGIWESLGDSQMIADTIQAGIDLDSTYEGGGLYRLSGLLFSKLPPINPRGPNRDMERAFGDFRRALDSGVFVDPVFPDWKDPNTETGDYFYSTYVYYAEALIAKRQNSEARELIEDVLARLNDGDLPLGREPEAMVAKTNLERLLRQL